MLAERCIIGFNAGPPFAPSAYNNNVQIVQTKDHVMLLNEMVHDARIVPLDTRPRGETAAVDGRVARPMGGRYARRRDDQLQGPDLVRRLEREDEADREIQRSTAATRCCTSSPSRIRRPG